jgi:hypothetical protein
MNIITYCSKNYYPCLKKFINSWKGKITIYSDSDLPIKHKVIKAFPKSEDWHINTERKILAVIEHLKTGEDFMYLDSDCKMRGEVDEVWHNHQDILFNRVIYRKDRLRGEKEANSGVFFIRSNERTKKFANEWLELARKYYQDHTLRKYHEQTAFSHLCLSAFDGLKPYSSGIISERIYNLEHDDKKEWLRMIKRYNPKIIHFKNCWWQDTYLTDKL